MRRLVALALAFTGGTAALHAQQLTGAAKWADSARTLIDAAVLTDAPAGLDSAVALLDRALAATPNEYLLLHYKGYARYRQGNASLGASNATLARKQFEEADTLLGTSAAQHPLAESFALRSSIAGRLAGLDPSAPILHKTMAGRMQARAEETGSSNPRVGLLRGQSVLFGPPDRTGGPAEAEKLLQRAHDLFATDSPAPPLPSWGRAETCAYLALARHRLGNDEGARAAAHEALSYAPGYRYVKNELLPMLGEKP